MPFFFLSEWQLESPQISASSPSFQLFFPLCGSLSVEVTQSQQAGYIKRGVSLQLAKRTGILAEAIAAILEMQNAVLRDLIQ